MSTSNPRLPIHAAHGTELTARSWQTEAPLRVLMNNLDLVGDWANWEEFRRLEELGLTMYGQMTAGSWIYIGTQGILQGTFETFAAIADKKFGGTLAGTIRSSRASRSAWRGRTSGRPGC